MILVHSNLRRKNTQSICHQRLKADSALLSSLVMMIYEDVEKVVFDFWHSYLDSKYLAPYPL